MGALDGIKVLDLSRVLAGPWATQILGDLGADVVKIEKPPGGDDTRGWGPPWQKDGNGVETGESAYYLSANRNKRSLAVDFTTPEGAELLQRMAAKADILVENFKAGGLAKYGLDYATLKAINPRLIYCSITGFGQTGPYAERPGYDFIIQGMGGLMSVTGVDEPVKVGVAHIDVMTGLYATIAILAAIQARHVSGMGQYIDMALLDVCVATLANQGLNYLASGNVPQRLGNAHPNIVPYQAFKTADDWLILAIGNDGQFRRFCHLSGKSEWAEDARFASNTARVAHREILVPMISDVMQTRTRAEWMTDFEAADIPHGPIQDMAQVFADPQVVARGMSLGLPHSSGGISPSIASPIRLSETPVQYRHAPPTCGADGTAILEEWLKN